MLPKYFHIGWKFQRIFKSSMSFCHPNNFLHTSYLSASKQMFHAFLFNIRNYSSEVRNIQQRKSELNIILPRVNNSILTKDGMVYLFFTYTKHETKSEWMFTRHIIIPVTTELSFFKKNQLEHFFFELFVNRQNSNFATWNWQLDPRSNHETCFG